MKITLNGAQREIDPPCSLATLLQRLGLEPNLVLIELNLQAVHRARWPDTPLSPGDRVEILTVAAGG